MTGSRYRAGRWVTGHTSRTGTFGGRTGGNHSSNVASSLKVMKVREQRAGGLAGPVPARGVGADAVGADAAGAGSSLRERETQSWGERRRGPGEAAAGRRPRSGRGCSVTAGRGGGHWAGQSPEDQGEKEGAGEGGRQTAKCQRTGTNRPPELSGGKGGPLPATATHPSTSTFSSLGPGSPTSGTVTE